jgi:hypothetical protein
VRTLLLSLSVLWIGCGSSPITCSGALPTVCGTELSCPATLAEFKQQICSKQSLTVETCADGFTAIAVSATATMVTYYYDAKGQLAVIVTDNNPNYCYGPGSFVVPSCGAAKPCTS